ncbi:MAG: ABC transporter permease [Lactobacillales bacterium]|jgi:D-methionine transport system permease protein|nr:ABC transporter permease [Lactobacillales bacterium]
MGDKTFVERYLDFNKVNWLEIKQATIDTLYMAVISMIFTIILGFILGLLLYTLSRRKTMGGKIAYSIISIVSNICRSIPYIILLVLLIPFTKALVGTMIGAKSVIPSLIVSATPFYARLVEVAFREVDSGVLEAADAMGASLSEKILKVLLPESLPALLSGVTITSVSMIGYTAMGGVVGGGGLGGYAYQQGYSLSNYSVVVVATVIILIMVFIIQFVGDTLVKRSDKRI